MLKEQCIFYYMGKSNNFTLSKRLLFKFNGYLTQISSSNFGFICRNENLNI